MSKVKNRHERHAGQVRRARARKAFEIIKDRSVRLSTIPYLYKQCLDGVTFFEALRERDIPRPEGPFLYSSLRGQQDAHLFAKATMDDVLTVLVWERSDRKWAWDIVVDLDDGFAFGSPETMPCATREEAAQAALMGGLGMIGRSSEPAPCYEPEAEPEKNIQIRVNAATYRVNDISSADPTKFRHCLIEAMQVESTTYEGLLANFAHLVLVDGVEDHVAALTVLANCGWTDVTREILENYCAANGLDDRWAV
jgi:hypothetical protein